MRFTSNSGRAAGSRRAAFQEQDLPQQAAARSTRDDEARGGPPHQCRPDQLGGSDCNIAATDHARIYSGCGWNAASGEEHARRRAANDYAAAVAQGWTPDAIGWTPPVTDQDQPRPAGPPGMFTTADLPRESPPPQAPPRPHGTARLASSCQSCGEVLRGAGLEAEELKHLGRSLKCATWAEGRSRAETFTRRRA